MTYDNQKKLGLRIPFFCYCAGAKVYKSELILSGIISYHLDFSKYPLFDSLLLLEA
jgi:hypothetical protein